MSTFGRLAPQLADDGWQPIPVRPHEKLPAPRGWQTAPSARVMERWLVRHAAGGIGFVGGRVVGIDIDVLDNDAAARLMGLVTAHLGGTPLVRVGRSPKLLLVYRLTEPMPTRRIALSVGRIEALAEGAFFVGYGIHPDTGQPYEWIGDSSPEFTPVSAIPCVTPLQVEDVLEQALRLFPAVQIPEGKAPALEGTKVGRPAGGRIVLCPRSGRVVDGRDLHLARLVWAACHQLEHPTAQEVADAAWQEFAATADLARPARDKRRGWEPRDALSKAKAALRKMEAGAVKRVRRSRGRMATPSGSNPNEAERDAFRGYVLALHEDRRLSISAWRVSGVMLDRLRDGQCVDSVAFLADLLRVSAETLRRARKELLISELWQTARQLGNRQATAPYFPSPKIIAKALARQLVLGGGRSTLTPIYQCGGSGSQEGVSDFIEQASPEPAPLPLLPPQLADAIQLSMLPPAVSEADLLPVLAAWSDGPMPALVRTAHAEKKLRLGLRERDIAAKVRVSREHLANARFETFNLSPAAVAREKHWLMPEAFPSPPKEPADQDRPPRPHHRRGGKRPPPPAPTLPMLRIFQVIKGDEPLTVRPQRRRRNAA